MLHNSMALVGRRVRLAATNEYGLLVGALEYGGRGGIHIVQIRLDSGVNVVVTAAEVDLA